MKKILIFAGTTEGRRLSECLVEAEIEHTLCVATEYGETVLEQEPLVQVLRGRMNQEEIRELLLAKDYNVVIDATHPYAKIVTQNIKGAVDEVKGRGKQISYLHLRREPATDEKHRPGSKESAQQIRFYDTCEDCARALEGTKGNILLTTGSKDLPAFCTSETLKKRLYVRVLPSIESLSLCMKNGICGKQIIAMQGPFQREMNEAIIAQYQITQLITKESGDFGGYREKLEAAKRAEIPVSVIGRPGEEEGISFSETVRELEKLCGRKIFCEGCFQIVLAGVGMGSKKGMTGEVREAIEEADVLLGAERILQHALPGTAVYPFYRAKEVVPCLEKLQENLVFSGDRKVVILLSGDSGFYSGCKSLYDALGREIEAGRLRAVLRVLPGTSAVSCLAACVGESYQDAAVYSMHGKQVCNLARRIRSNSKTFLLTSGVKDVNWLGEQLVEAGLAECEVVVGYQLSYEDQRIASLTPMQCCELRKEGLYICLVKNPRAEKRRLTHGLSDAAFARGGVPMTKEEVREVSICKLRLWQDAVVYDIGSGTGSTALEIAGLSDEIQVYALERRTEAVALIKKNRERHGLQNITVIEGQAPETLCGLPAATHAFIGGSGGKMKEIVQTLYRINPYMRVVMNAVSLETLCEMKEVLTTFPIKEREMVQIQAGRVKETGNYHLIQAENPIWVCSFSFDGVKR